MIEKMDSLKRTILELLIGILIFGILFEVVGVFLVKEKAAYSVGILCGVIMAVLMLLHMAHNLDDALSWDEVNARRSVRAGTMRRYMAVSIATILLGYFKIGNVLSCFLGIMSLKTAVYIQPFVHRIINRILKIEEGGYENAIIDDDDAEFDFSEWAERGFHDSWFN